LGLKNNILLLCSVVSLLTFSGFAQEKESRHIRSKQVEEVETPDDLADSDLTIVSYHVVETIKKAMGSSITTYDVTSLSMINSNDLGPNNTRIITPKYVRTKSLKKAASPNAVGDAVPVPTKTLTAKEQAAKEEEAKIEAAITEVVKEEILKAEVAKKEAAKAEAVKEEAAKAEAAQKEATLAAEKAAEAAKVATAKVALTPTERATTEPTAANPKMVAIPASKTGSEPAKVAPKKKENYVTIDIVNTYERVLEKGYKSVDMLMKVADRHFLNNELDQAAKWYNQLFELSKDQDAVHYYRYAKALEAINELEKSNEMMAVFRIKNQQER
jgi:N-acetylmuramoyl-L-alanine amidase